MNENITYLTVTALNRYIDRKFSNDPYLKEIYIKGEVSNCKLHSNKTLYFSIKDDNTVINAQKYNYDDSLIINDGDLVLIKASVNFYFPYGKYTLIVSEIKKDRVGDLYSKFIELKSSLSKEGIFSLEYKKIIPKINFNIAVVTSATGAAIQDIKKTIYRRFPIANINLYPTLVQGENSVQDIISNLKKADNDNNDVIILARGGGAIEDLWSFNNEQVVRTIFNCKTPIITGVGHETDTTLVDFVSDYNASTPTAAAEAATSMTIENLKSQLKLYYEKIYKLINNKILENKLKIENKKNNHYIKNFIQINNDNKIILLNKSKYINLLINKLLNVKKNNLHNDIIKIRNINLIKNKKNDFKFAVNNFENNSPLKILNKGYAIINNESNKKISSIKQLKLNENIKINVVDGTIEATVLELKEEGI